MCVTLYNDGRCVLQFRVEWLVVCGPSDGHPAPLWPAGGSQARVGCPGTLHLEILLMLYHI